MSWTTLKAAVTAVITANGNNEITGTILKELFNNNIIPHLGSDKYKGEAVVATAPGTPEYQVWYLAMTFGNYTNFGHNIPIEEDGIYLLSWNGSSWDKILIYDRATVTLIKAEADKVKADKVKYMPKIDRITNGVIDGTIVPALSLNTVENDPINNKINNKAIKVNVLTATGHQIDIVRTPYVTEPPAVIGLWVYIEDATKLTSLKVMVYTSADLLTLSEYDASIIGGYINGWNLLRWKITSATTPFVLGDTIHMVRITGGSSAATSYTIADLWIENPPKAQLLFIQDGAEAEFLTRGYPELKERGIPVTWGIAPARIGVTNHIDEVEILEVSQENDNSISYHSWNVEVTDTMTEEQLKTDCITSLSWLRERGYFGGKFRAAFTQNLAQEADKVQGMHFALPFSNGGGGNMEVFPFNDKWNVRRYAIHAYNADAPALEALFDKLKEHNCLFVCYTHLITPAGSSVDCSDARYDQFLALCDTGVSEGWLEFVTADKLLERANIKTKTYGEDEWDKAVYENWENYGQIEQ